MLLTGKVVIVTGASKGLGEAIAKGAAAQGAKACVCLLSDMSSCITGANLLADCGMTSQLISKEPYAAKPIEGE